MLKDMNLKFFVVILIVVNSNINKTTAKLCDRRYLNEDIRIDGKVVIVTGGSSGLGLETAKNLAKRGGRIYIASRDENNGNSRAESIRKTTGNDNVHFIKLDLASLKSVRQFSDTFHKTENRLDILINNAGTVSAYQRTEDNLELNLAVNHLGHFLLTNLLLDLLKASAPSRILVVSSSSNLIGVMIRENLNSEMYFPGIIKAYSNSKLANILFARELSRKLTNSGVTVNSLDPGISMSAIGVTLPSNLKLLFEFFQGIIGRSPEFGVQTHLMLALDPSVNNISGKHFRDCMEQTPSFFATDQTIARWLWEDSARLTKLYQ